MRDDGGLGVDRTKYCSSKFLLFMLKLMERWSLVAMHAAHMEDLDTDTSLELNSKRARILSQFTESTNFSFSYRGTENQNKCTPFKYTWPYSIICIWWCLNVCLMLNATVILFIKKNVEMYDNDISLTVWECSFWDIYGNMTYSGYNWNWR